MGSFLEINKKKKMGEIEIEWKFRNVLSSSFISHVTAYKLNTAIMSFETHRVINRADTDTLYKYFSS